MLPHFTIQHFILEHQQIEFIKVISNIPVGANTFLLRISVGQNPATEGNNHYFTAGGYVLKYMYTISASNATKFLTTDFMPVETDSTVSAAANLMVRLNRYE